MVYSVFEIILVDLVYQLIGLQDGFDFPLFSPEDMARLDTELIDPDLKKLISIAEKVSIAFV